MKLTRERRNLLLGLALNLAPARDRLVDLPEAVIEKLLQARQLFAAKLPEAAADAVEFFEPGRYLATLSVRDNLIFGRIVTRHGRANERLKELIAWVADDGGIPRPGRRGRAWTTASASAALSSRRSSARSWCWRPAC